MKNVQLTKNREVCQMVSIFLYEVLKNTQTLNMHSPLNILHLLLFTLKY